jgi:hypothetical protein
MNTNTTLSRACLDLARAFWRYLRDVAAFSLHKLSVR